MPNATVATERVAVIRTCVTGSPSTTTSSVPAISCEEKVHPGTCAEPHSSVGIGVGFAVHALQRDDATSTLCESNGHRSM